MSNFRNPLLPSRSARCSPTERAFNGTTSIELSTAIGAPVSAVSNAGSDGVPKIHEPVLDPSPRYDLEQFDPDRHPIGLRLGGARRLRWLRPRPAVTLMETIIAIGIIIGGLVGVAALIPVAARNAQETIELDRGAGESVSAAVEGKIREFHDLDSIVIWDKPVRGSVAANDYQPAGAMVSVNWKLRDQPSTVPPLGEMIGHLESPGYDHMDRRSGLSAAICIDPLGLPQLALARSNPPNAATDFVNDPLAPTPFWVPQASDNSFDYSRFPYYNERYNPLAPPNAAVGNPAPPWPMSPRMWRATLKAPMYADSPAPVQSHQLLSASSVRSIFRTSGAVSAFGDRDGQPGSVLVSRTRIGGAVVDGARDASSDYSWFVTLTPPYPTGQLFRQSIVVVRQRQPPVPKRPGDPLALQKRNYTVQEAEQNPTNERLTWIDPLTVVGFRGGVGGDVMIYGSQAISDKIINGEWVMLSRQPHIWDEVSETIVGPYGPALHRWYRVLAVGETELIETHQDLDSWSDGATRIWRKRVTLSGPDWNFQDERPLPPPIPNSTGVDDTFCTIIDGAISVVESEVELR